MSDRQQASGSPAGSETLVLLDLDERHYALPLRNVDRIEQAVEVTPLPQAPEIVMGVIRVREQVIPVIDVRRRFRLAAKEIALSDQMVIARARRRTVALLVDQVAGVIDISSAAAVPGYEVFPELQYLRGVVKLEDGLVLIHDLDEFLSLEEESGLDRALSLDSRNE